MAATTDFDVGDRVVMTATITDPADHTSLPQVDGEALVDPPSVTITVQTPGGSVSIDAVRIAQGIYEASIVAVAPGHHSYAADVPEPYKAAERSSFYVRRPAA